MAPVNILLSGLPSSGTLCLHLGDHTTALPYTVLSAAIHRLTGLSPSSFYLRQAGALLPAHAFVTTPGQHTAFISLALRRILPGGKGGFGAQLRGSAASTKTTNFDACRDLHGRRLRAVRMQHVLTEVTRNSNPIQPHQEPHASHHQHPSSPSSHFQHDKLHDASHSSSPNPRKRARAVEHGASANIPSQLVDDGDTGHDAIRKVSSHENVDRVNLDDTLAATARSVTDAVAHGLAIARRRKRARVEPFSVSDAVSPSIASNACALVAEYASSSSSEDDEDERRNDDGDVVMFSCANRDLVMPNTS